MSFEEKQQELQNLEAEVKKQEEQKLQKKLNDENILKKRVAQEDELEAITKKQTETLLKEKIQRSLQEAQKTKEEIEGLQAENVDIFHGSGIQEKDTYKKPNYSIKFKKLSDLSTRGGVVVESLNKDKREGAYACFIGQKDSGKTMFIQTLCGNEEPCKQKYKNCGVDFYHPTGELSKVTLLETQSIDQDVLAFEQLYEYNVQLERRKEVLTVDDKNLNNYDSMVGGMDDPAEDPFQDEQFNDLSQQIKKEHKNITQKKTEIIDEYLATTLMLFKYSMKKKGVIIVPVKDFTSQVEKFLEQLIDYVYDPYNKEKSSEIIVIHNYSQIREKKEIDSRIQRAIKNNHNVEEYDVNKGFFDYSRSRDYPITHLVYAQQGSEAGNIYNQNTISILKSRIKSSIQQNKIKPVMDFKQYLSDELQGYYELDGEELIREEQEEGKEQKNDFNVQYVEYQPSEDQPKEKILFCKTLNFNPNLKFKKMLSIDKFLKLESEKNVPNYQVITDYTTPNTNNNRPIIKLLIEVPQNIEEPELILQQIQGKNCLIFKTETNTKTPDNLEDYDPKSVFTQNKSTIKRGKIEAKIFISKINYTVLKDSIEKVEHKNGLLQYNVPVSQILNEN